MQKVIYTLIICLSFGITAHTQVTKTNSESCQNLEGTLRDKNTDEVIPYALIALYQDGTLIQGEDTDEQGNYTFTNLPKGVYQVKTSIFGEEVVDVFEVDIKDYSTKYLDMDIENSINLTTVEVIEYLNPVIINCVCTQGIKSNDCCYCGSRKIITRNTPSPAAKDPDKPIKELNLYPNPSFGEIHIELTFETLRIRLFDMLGHDLGEVPYTLIEDEKVSLDLSGLPSSTYVLQLQHEEGTDIQKVIILDD